MRLSLRLLSAVSGVSIAFRGWVHFRVVIFDKIR